MTKRVAVITDAMASDYFFPYWHRYYAAQFGAENLHVVTYAGLGPAFAGFTLGSLEALPSLYDDTQRPLHIAGRVAELLKTHDVVLRCDVDEFLVPDPRKHASLAAYVEGNALPYVTARGVDLVEVEEDPPLILDGRPLLEQRRWGVRTASLSKTALTTVPMTWSPGFHAANVRPVFDDLFLVHTKFADIKGRVAWFARMLTKVLPGSCEAAYYGDGQAKLEGYGHWLQGLERVFALTMTATDRSAFDTAFLRTVLRNEITGFEQGEFRVDCSLRLIESSFSL
jgi:hypothetical protein